MVARPAERIKLLTALLQVFLFAQELPLAQVALGVIRSLLATEAAFDRGPLDQSLSLFILVLPLDHHLVKRESMTGAAIVLPHDAVAPVRRHLLGRRAFLRVLDQARHAVIRERLDEGRDGF